MHTEHAYYARVRASCAFLSIRSLLELKVVPLHSDMQSTEGAQPMNKTSEFTWIGINASGKKISGNLLARNKKIVQEKLLSDHVTILSIQKKLSITLFSKAKKFTHKQRLDFTQQLHLLLQSGIPLVDALSLTADNSPCKTTQTLINKIKEKIITGNPFAKALRDFPDCFDSTFCQMISIGEQSGQLEFVLSQLIENQEHQAAMKNKIAKALFYPATVLCIAILISIGLLIFVIPQFSSIYQNFGAQLPSMTTALIHLSKIITHHLLMIPFCIVLFFALIQIGFKKNNALKNKINDLLFRIRPYRSLYMTKQIAQWGRLIGMMLPTGIPLIEALQIANRTMTQSQLQQQMQNVQKGVVAGESLHAALNHCPHFPKRAKYLISIGENADALDVMMNRLAAIYQKKFETTLDHLSKLLEPVIMIGVAGLISGLIIAMYLPIFRMGSVI